jgi:hypothetical protein
MIANKVSATKCVEQLRLFRRFQHTGEKTVRIAHIVAFPVSEKLLIFASPEMPPSESKISIKEDPRPLVKRITDKSWWNQKCVHDWPHQAHQRWEALNHPTASSWKKKLYHQGSRILSKLEWEEMLAKKWDTPQKVHPEVFFFLFNG